LLHFGVQKFAHVAQLVAEGPLEFVLEPHAQYSTFVGRPELFQPHALLETQFHLILSAGIIVRRLSVMRAIDSFSGTPFCWFVAKVFIVACGLVVVRLVRGGRGVLLVCLGTRVRLCVRHSGCIVGVLVYVLDAIAQC
jgi:hypothetical protein